jgi:hypothetical protein
MVCPTLFMIQLLGLPPGLGAEPEIMVEPFPVNVQLGATLKFSVHRIVCPKETLKTKKQTPKNSKILFILHGAKWFIIERISSLL